MNNLPLSRNCMGKRLMLFLHAMIMALAIPVGFRCSAYGFQDPNWPDMLANAYDYNGQLYYDSTCTTLLLIPESYNRDETIILSENVRAIWEDAIRNLENLRTLIIPNKESIDLDIHAIAGNPNLREIVFGGILGKTYYECTIEGNPQLRSIVFAEGQKNLEVFYSFTYSLTKVYLPPTIESLGYHAFGDDNIMFINLPNVRSIGRYALGEARYILLGDKIETMNTIWYDSWYSYKGRADRDICCLGLTPPRTDPGYYRDEGFTGPFPGWTIHVPPEAVETYKADPYWGHLGKIVPITDKLIPIVSEPTVRMEEDWTHDYLWDVMPLGNAVPDKSGVWASEDPDVASIDQDGLLTAHRPGHTTVSFTIRDQHGNPYTAYSEVNVTETGAVGEIDDDQPSSAGASATSIPDGVYNLHGQRVADSVDALTPGLYIHIESGHASKVIR